jgi:membrane protein implicated in regulation of membrane protease activity
MDMQALSKILNSLNQWHWFGFAVIFIMFELIVGASFFLLWTGISAALIGVTLVLYPSLPWEFQFILFSCISFACIIFWHIHLKHIATKGGEPKLNRRSAQFVGRVVTLSEPIVNGRGKIHIEDSFWRIEGPDLPAGTLVKVIDTDGVILRVIKHE